MNRNEGEELYFKGSLIVEGNRILAVSTDEEYIDSYCRDNSVRVIDASNRIVMPGLINTHTHIPMGLMRGYADDMTLMEWLNKKIWPFEAKKTEEDAYWGSKLGMAEMLLGGTTSFIDMYFYINQVHRATVESGMRAMLSGVIFDANHLAFEEMFKTQWDEFDRQNGRISLCVGPHSAYTCSPETLLMAARVAGKFDVPIHIHMSEDKDEFELINSHYGKTPTQHLYGLGIFEQKTLAAHCVHLTEEDIDIVRRKNVTVLHNPHSNLKLASGIAPIQDYLSKGICVSIGTDSASSNNNLCMWEEMRTASLLQKVIKSDPCALKAYETLQLATINGAKAMGMEGKLGVLEAGALADIILIDIEKPHLYPRFNLVAHLVYSVRNEDVDTVIVNGEIVVENRNLLTMDLSRIFEETERRAKEIVHRVSSTNN